MSHCIMHKSCVLYLVKAKLGHCLLHGHSQMIWIPVSGFTTTQSPCLSEVRNWNAFPTPSTRSTCSDWVLAPTSPDSAVPGDLLMLASTPFNPCTFGPHIFGSVSPSRLWWTAEAVWKARFHCGFTIVSTLRYLKVGQLNSMEFLPRLSIEVKGTAYFFFQMFQLHSDCEVEQRHAPSAASVA